MSLYLYYLYNLRSTNIKNSTAEWSFSEKFLIVTVDSNFTFKKHNNELCKKDYEKLHALARCTKYITDKRRTLFNPIQDEGQKDLPVFPL